MQNHHRPYQQPPSWSVEEHETREQGVWIARLVSSILAAGWNALWMGLACVLAGCVATLAVLHRPASLQRAPAPAAAPVALAPIVGESELRLVREELASLRQQTTEMEARQREERSRAALERLAAEEERARTGRLLDAERERRVRAEEERDRALEERSSRPAPVTMAWPAPPPVVTPMNLQALVTQQLLQQMAHSMPMPMEPWPVVEP
jgi:hypothetical protein